MTTVAPSSSTDIVWPERMRGEPPHELPIIVLDAAYFAAHPVPAASVRYQMQRASKGKPPIQSLPSSKRALFSWYLRNRPGVREVTWTLYYEFQKLPCSMCGKHEPKIEVDHCRPFAALVSEWLRLHPDVNVWNLQWGWQPYEVPESPGHLVPLTPGLDEMCKSFDEFHFQQGLYRPVCQVCHLKHSLGPK